VLIRNFLLRFGVVTGVLTLEKGDNKINDSESEL